MDEIYVGSEERGAGAEGKAKFSKAPVLGAFFQFCIVYILIYFDGFISKKHVGC